MRVLLRCECWHGMHCRWFGSTGARALEVFSADPLSGARTTVVDFNQPPNQVGVKPDGIVLDRSGGNILVLDFDAGTGSNEPEYGAWGQSDFRLREPAAGTRRPEGL